MSKIEKIRPAAINKDISPRAVDQQGNRLVVNPYLDRLNSRFRSAETAELMAEQNIPGTVVKTNSALPATGTNLTIGCFTDREAGRFITFNYNSLGVHGIYTYNPITNTWATIIQSSLLAFSSDPRYRITGVGIVQNNLYFADGLNPSRHIDLTHNYAGITVDAPINLYKRPPVKGPKLVVGFNSITADLSTGSNIIQIATGLSDGDIDWTSFKDIDLAWFTDFGSSYEFSESSKIYVLNEVLNEGQTYYLNLSLNIGTNIQIAYITSGGTIHSYSANLSGLEQNVPIVIPSGVNRVGLFASINGSGLPSSGTGAQTSEILHFSLLVDSDHLINDTSKPTSSIAKNIYQFSTRYLFKQNEVSALSQWSNPVNAYPSDTLSKFLFNGMEMTIYLQDEIQSIVSKVQLLYRKNNSANWYLYSEHLPGAFTSGALVTRFFDDNSSTIIPLSETSKLYDSVPLLSKALAAFKNRNFAIADKEGYDISTIQDYTVSKTQELVLLSLKEGADFSYSIIYYDKDMRTMGATALKKVTIQYETGLSTGVDLSLRTVSRIVFNDNNHPAWAKYVTVARTKEQNYESYMQIPVKVTFYVSEGELKDAAGSLITLPGHAEKYNNGKVYLNDLPNNSSRKFYKIHWQTPENIPFIPDSECFIRVITPLTGLTKEDTTSVIAFDGVSIITNNIGNLNWASSGYTPADGLLIEVFKFKKVPEKLLYELSQFTQTLPVTLPFTAPSDIYDWDAYVNDINIPYAAKHLFKNMKIDSEATDAVYNISALLLQKNSETPSGIFNNVEGSQDTKNSTYSSFASEQASNTPDYTRIPDYPGRAIAYNPSPKQLTRKTTVRFSDTFIQDSRINGLSSFSGTNEVSLPTYRSPIKKLQPAGNVLLAIHERTTTSIYVGEGFIKNADGTEVLAKTDSVIGQERELTMGLGAYHAESVAEWGSIVFGFDLFKGIVWRYDNNGQVPVSDFGMKAYFYQKANDYLQYKDTVAILGGIDPFHKEYIIHFPAAGAFAAETWAFNFATNEWVGRFSFVPECMGHINNLFVSFKNGQLWAHNQDRTNYNTFYGVRYSRSVTIAVNPFPSQVKNYHAIQISAEELTEGDIYTISNHANVAAFPGSGSAGTRYVALDTRKSYTWNGASYDNISEVQIFTAVNREGQSTYMKRKEFEKMEGLFYSWILKDLNTPTGLMTGSQLKLRDGKDMLSQVLDVTLTNNSKSVARQHYFNITYEHSKMSV